VTLGCRSCAPSVDHGTALDIAGTGRADAGSLREALELAIELASSRKRFGQHFLHDPRVLARLVDAISPQAGDVLVRDRAGEGARSLAAAT